MAVRQAALVSDESALEACLRRCAIQIDDLYLYLYLCVTLVCQTTHQLLQCSAQLMRPAPVYTTTTSRPWARLDADAFRAALLASSLCPRDDTWSTLRIDDLARLYDDSTTTVLDDILPLRTVRCQRCPSYRTRGSMMNVATPNGVFVVLSMLHPTLPGASIPLSTRRQLSPQL